MIRHHIRHFRLWLSRMLYPRAIACDLNRHIQRQALIERGRVRR